jgi:hypothetical protein
MRIEARIKIKWDPSMSAPIADIEIGIPTEFGYKYLSKEALDPNTYICGQLLDYNWGTYRDDMRWAKMELQVLDPNELMKKSRDMVEKWFTDIERVVKENRRKYEEGKLILMHKEI